MKNLLLLAAAAGFALTMTVAPTLAAAGHTAAANGHTAAQHQTGKHEALHLQGPGSNYGVSCASMLADPSQYSLADVRRCE